MKQKQEEKTDDPVTLEATVIALQERLAESEAERRQLQQVIVEAMIVLAPNMPESGLVDACRQVKQAALSECDNAEVAEQELDHTQELFRIAVKDGAAHLHRAVIAEAERASLQTHLAGLRASLEDLLKVIAIYGYTGGSRQRAVARLAALSDPAKAPK